LIGGYISPPTVDPIPDNKPNGVRNTKPIFKVEHRSLIRKGITAKDWSESQILIRREGVGQKEITRRLKISRMMVKQALDS
jgi:hypothetical protein